MRLDTFKISLSIIVSWFFPVCFAALVPIQEQQNNFIDSRASKGKEHTIHEENRVIGADVPFITYEAESSNNIIKAKILRLTGLPGRTDRSPELEASGHAYVSLESTGEYLEIHITTAANAMVIRHSIPDAPRGGGENATLSLYINDQHSQDVTLSSRYNWLYGNPARNSQRNNPTAGRPHVFWDETRLILEQAVSAGDTIKLQKDSRDDAAYYKVDLVDLEVAPPPLAPPQAGTYISVEQCGANGKDTSDDTVAIQDCIVRAKSKGKSVWIPAGTYYQHKRFKLDSVTLRGAGVWHTSIIGTANDKTWGGNVGFIVKGTGSRVSDMYITSQALTSRLDKGGKAFTGKAKGAVLENLWITHTNVGFWMSKAEGVTIRNNRVRMTYADGINVNRGARDCIIEHNHVRGTGDDGIAILSEVSKQDPPSMNNIIRFNTVIAPWWGGNIHVAGGFGHRIEQNLIADSSPSGALILSLPKAYPMHSLTDTLITGNRILRGGGNLGGQRRGAIWIFPGFAEITNVVFQDNHIIRPLFCGIHISHGQDQIIVFEGNIIDEPGENGIYIEPKARGRGVFKNNKVIDIKDGFRPLLNKAGNRYEVEAAGNSWQ